MELPTHIDQFNRRFVSYLQSKDCRIHFVKILISMGADVNYKDSNLNTPLHIVLRHCGDKLNLVRVLLAAGANVNACNMQGRSALHFAVLFSDDVEILRELTLRGALLHLKDSDNNSPLHLAVQNNKRPFVQALIRSGADVDMKNAEEDSPLVIAVRDGNVEMVKLLLRSKASILVTCRNASTPLHVAVDCTPPNQGVLIELMKYDADMFRSDARMNSPLYCAMRKFDNSSLFCTRTLLKCGVLQGRLSQDIEVNPTVLVILHKLNNFAESKIFIDECTLEMKKMKVEFIHKNFSLFDFVRDGFESYPMSRTKTAYREWVFNRVLYISRKYPLYADIIAYRLGKLDLCKKAMELSVYALKECLEGKQPIFLPPDLLFLISRFLSNEEVLNFITALSDPQNFASHDFGFRNLALGKSVKRKLSMIF